MGIESFYINAKYKENIFKNSNKSIIEFLSILEDNGFTVRYNNKKMKYIINKILYMDILEDELYFNGISLEGCLSCFEQAYTCMVELLVLIDTKFHKIQITNNNSIFENINNKNLLITYIQDCFKHQKEKFDTIYIYKIKSLPGKEFYRKYKFFSFFPLPTNTN